MVSLQNETIDEMLQVIEANKLIMGLTQKVVELTALTLRYNGVVSSFGVNDFIEEMVMKRGLDEDTINAYKERCVKLYESYMLTDEEWDEQFQELDSEIDFDNPILALTQTIILAEVYNHRQDMKDDSVEDDMPPMDINLGDYIFDNNKVKIVVHSDDNESFDCTVTIGDNQQTKSFESFEELLYGIGGLYSYDVLETEELTEIASMLYYHFDIDEMTIEEAVEYITK